MLVFIDADTILPKYFIQSFENRVNEKHFQAGSFTQKMNSDNLAIRAGAHFMSGYMRLMQYTPWPIGFGGCLYITKEAFNALHGFDESLYIMEDYDIILQAKRAGYKKITAKIPIQVSKKLNNYSADILVPTCSPLAARTRLSSCSNLQTTNGNL